MSNKKVDIYNELTTSGLIVKVGVFKYRICSPLPILGNSISVLYADYELSEYNDCSGFVDFHVLVKGIGGCFSALSRKAQFFVDDQAPFNALPKQHAPAIIEWGMNWCISSQINSHLIVHAAVIEKNGKAAVLPAPPGSGKSTLTASLIQEGWRLLSDELTIIRLDNYYVSPNPRPVSLKNESIDVIKDKYPNVVFGPISTDTSKGNVCHIKPPKLSVINQHIESPITWVIFPKYQYQSKTYLTEYNKAKALMDIAENSFNYSRLGRQGFIALRNVVDNARCYQFQYSDLDEAIETFDSLGS